MPGNNISRAEAAERSKHLKVNNYKVSVEVTSSEETFLATTEVTFSCNQIGYSTFIDAVGKRIISAELNGAALDTSNFDGESFALTKDRKSTRLNSSHTDISRMPSSA